MKQGEISKIHEIEKNLFEKNQKEEKDRIIIQERNDELQQIANTLKNELEQVTM